MWRIITFSIFLLSIIITSCIDPFTPLIESKESNKYVVNGLITDQVGYQTVTISLTSQLDNPDFIALTDCNVQIICNDQKVLTLTEYEDGIYSVWMDGDDLKTGTSYRLSIITPSGVEIGSEEEIMPDYHQVDSVYFIQEKKLTSNPNDTIKGIQFYIDINTSNTDCRFYKWELEETYEYRTTYPAEWYYDGTIHRYWPPDYSKSICWSTALIKNFYTLSTENTRNNIYKKHPLNFVDNRTPRLLYGYSLLIEQYGLSEAGYTYWEQTRINSSERGGLYETQPLPIQGNLKNLTYPKQRILGFFGASTLKTKRVFIQNIENLEIQNSSLCSPIFLRFGFKDIEEREYPAYFIWGPESQVWLLQESCIDCRKLGGTIVKPDFWPY